MIETQVRLQILFDRAHPLHAGACSYGDGDRDRGPTALSPADGPQLRALCALGISAIEQATKGRHFILQT